MFGVRGVNGEVFRGPIELLLRTHRMLALPPARAVENEEDGHLRDVRLIARVMLEYHLPGLPVVDEATGVLQGIVSLSDQLRCVVTEPPLTLWA